MTPEQQVAIRQTVARAMHPDDWERLSRNNRCNALLTADAAMAAHLKAMEAAGVVTCPVEPTDKMVMAGGDVVVDYDSDFKMPDSHAREAYKRMIAARPR